MDKQKLIHSILYHVILDSDSIISSSYIKERTKSYFKHIYGNYNDWGHYLPIEKIKKELKQRLIS